MNRLDQLKQFTTVVADTGDFEAMRVYEPQDATTNPSLILKAVGKSAYKPLMQKTVDAHRNDAPADVIDHLLIAFGLQILQIVPGRVSTEVDARLSFDTAGTIAKAHQLIALYRAEGIERDRVLIKVASTWEGIRAVEALEREGIHCNMTLLFGMPQAYEAAEAGATLVSPFVGRITDWFKKHEEKDSYTPEYDPGVRFVRNVYATFKARGYPTQIMGASFRTVEQVLALAGCDLLTISPDLLEELMKSDSKVNAKLGDGRGGEVAEPVLFDEPRFRFAMNEDAMATEKLAEGIRTFASDAIKLEKLIAELQA